MFVNRRELEAFHRTYVCEREARELLGLTSHSLIENIEQGLLHPIEVPKRLNTRSVLLFSREEVVHQQSQIAEASAKF